MSMNPESCHVVAFERESSATKVLEVILLESTVTLGPEYELGS